jgi:hypothetical protein
MWPARELGWDLESRALVSEWVLENWLLLPRSRWSYK